jgi:hypothetical protein
MDRPPPWTPDDDFLLKNAIEVSLSLSLSIFISLIPFIPSQLALIETLDYALVPQLCFNVAQRRMQWYLFIYFLL